MRKTLDLGIGFVPGPVPGLVPGFAQEAVEAGPRRQILALTGQFRQGGRLAWRLAGELRGIANAWNGGAFICAELVVRRLPVDHRPLLGQIWPPFVHRRKVRSLMPSLVQALALPAPALTASSIRTTVAWRYGVLILRPRSALQTVPRTV